MDTPEGSPKPKPKTLTGLAALGNASVKERLFGPQNTYKEFMALPLLDKLQTIFLKRRNIKENQKPQGGEIRFMRETAAQEALRLSTEERSRLGIRIIAIGPLDENGKLIIDDPKNSRYQICISFPLHNMNHFIS